MATAPKSATTQVLSLAEAEAHFSSVVTGVQQTRTPVTISRRGAVAVSPALWAEQALQLKGPNLLAYNPKDYINPCLYPTRAQDPADRISIASAQLEQMTLVTRDQEVLRFANATRLSVLEA